MNLEFLIAKRVGTATKKSFSRAILRLAVIAIALSMMVMIIATSVVSGFKNTISDKIFGFWGHIHITTNYNTSSYAFESSPMNQTQDFYPSLDTTGQILYNQPVIDWLPTIAENSSNPNVYIALVLVIMGFLSFFSFKKRVRSIWIRILFGLQLISTGITLFVRQPYIIIEKDSVQQTQGGINHIQQFIQKEGIIKTKDQIEGIILRGVGEDFNWDFLQQYLLEGEVLNTEAAKAERGILVSETTASRLKLKLGDTFLIYFVQNGTSLGRKFSITGIYKTGLAEYDRRFAIVDIRKLQQLNNWRPYRNYGSEIELDDEPVALKGLTTATAEEDKGWQYIKENLSQGSLIDLEDEASIGAVVPYSVAYSKQVGIGDTLKFRYTDLGNNVHIFNYLVQGIYEAPSYVKKPVFVHWQSINNLNQYLPPQISGFEIFVDNIDDLEPFGNYVNYVTLMGKEQYASTLKEIEPNIFDWLNLTDMNERIILLLMILVSIINMTTSLMILILERTNMIGILKALGAQNWSIRKIFLYNSAYIIGYGLFWGNVIGIGLCLLQQQFGIIALPEEMYYVPIVPVEINWLTILLLNIGTMFITLLVLVLPSWLVAKIDPVKAIRFS